MQQLKAEQLPRGDTAPARRGGAVAVRGRRLAIVVPTAQWIARIGRAFVSEAARRGHLIHCFAPDWDERSARFAASIGADPRIIKLPKDGMSPLADERAIRQLTRIFEEMRPHTALGVSLKPAALTAIAARRAGTPFAAAMIHDIDSALAPGGALSSWTRQLAVKPLWRAGIKSADCLILTTEADEEAVAALGKLPRDLAVVCAFAPGVNMEQIPHLALPPFDRGPVFFMAADLDVRQGVHEYCEAAELLRGRARNARCVLAGKPGQGRGAIPLDELKRYRAAVQYLGPRDDLAQLIARAHAVVAAPQGPSRSNAVILALALGRPVIATDVRGLTEAVEDGVNGLLAPPGDPAALAKAMAYLLQRPDQIPRMANASRAMAMRKYDMRAVTRTLLQAVRLY